MQNSGFKINDSSKVNIKWNPVTPDDGNSAESLPV